MENYRILLAGDTHIVVEFGNKISEDINMKVKQLCASLQMHRPKGILEIVPTYRSVLIGYDPARISYRRLRRIVEKNINHTSEGKSGRRIIEIPVCYDKEFGIDLEDVAEYTGRTVSEIIKIHSERDYLVYMVGFLPGFPYLGGMDESIAVPRLKSPRLCIPAGSIGLAGSQTGIYPVDSPGGWRLIGKTPISIYDPLKENPVLFEAGDFIRFCPIHRKAYDEICALDRHGGYRCRILKGENAS